MTTATLNMRTDPMPGTTCDYCDHAATDVFHAPLEGSQVWRYRTCGIHSFLFTCEEERTLSLAFSFIGITRLENTSGRNHRGRMHRVIGDVRGVADRVGAVLSDFIDDNGAPLH
jgi:hypothetical protein